MDEKVGDMTHGQLMAGLAQLLDIKLSSSATKEDLLATSGHLNGIVCEEEVFEDGHTVYKCKECSRTFCNLFSLDSHKGRGCVKEPSKLCHLCPFITRQASNLTRHLALIHKIKPKSTTCSRNFESQICHKCGHIFNSKNSLDSHLRYFCGKEPNRCCPLCEYRTKSPSQLNAHMKCVHKVLCVRKFRSDVTERIAQLSSCKVPEGYKCPKCDKIVKSLYGLRRHLTKICGITPSHCCPLCDFKSKVLPVVRRHLNKKHQIKSFEEVVSNKIKENNVTTSVNVTASVAHENNQMG